MITGRPKRQGLDYFPLAVDFFGDPKIRALSAEFGCKGEITAIKLLCAVYRKGYFIQWDDRMRIEMLGELPGMSENLLQQIINRLVKWDFFDKNLFHSDKVITSKTIQKIYFHAIKRRKPTETLPYLLIPPDEVMRTKKDFMYAESQFMYAESQQSNKRKSINNIDFSTTTTRVRESKIKDEIESLKSNGKFVELQSQLHHLPVDEIRARLDAFALWMESINGKGGSDLPKHFSSWLGSRLRIEEKENDKKNKGNGQNRRRDSTDYVAEAQRLAIEKTQRFIRETEARKGGFS